MELVGDAQRSLLQASSDAGFGFFYQTVGTQNLVCKAAEENSWLQSKGTNAEANLSQGFQWLGVATCGLSLLFYAYNYWKATCGWEEVYVILVELVKVFIELFAEFSTPATVYLADGNPLVWLRYAEWLLSCPVILIHLSNLTGREEEYSSRTMVLLVSDLGCIVCGITSAFATSPIIKWVFFGFGCIYSMITYFHAAKAYMEAYQVVPDDTCRTMVKVMAYVFFVAWTLFPLWFVLGPEGAGVFSRHASSVAHTASDIIAKQLWSLLGHLVRVRVYEHVMVHGNIPSVHSVRKNKVAAERSAVSFVSEASRTTGHNRISNNKPAAIPTKTAPPNTADQPQTNGWKVESFKERQSLPTIPDHAV